MSPYDDPAVSAGEIAEYLYSPNSQTMKYLDLSTDQQRLECWLCKEFIINQQFSIEQWHEAFMQLNPSLDGNIINKAGRVAAYDWLHSKNPAA